MYPFREGSFAVRNGWYIAAFAHEVKRELLSRWIVNEPVILFRKEDATATALAGRCPHRHFPLGQGQLQGDTVICGYHGLAFAATGQCIHVPSQKTIPGVLNLKHYPLVERGMWLWIWPGDPALADESLIPDLKSPDYYEPDFRFRPFYSLQIEGRYPLMNDNLLDLTHLAYLHRSSIGTDDNASAPEEVQEFPRMIRSRRHMQGVEQAPFLRGRFDYDGPVDRVAGMDFHLPGFHAGVDEVTIPKSHPTRAGEKLVCARVFHAVTPALKHTTNYFFAMGGRMTEAELDHMQAYLRPVVEEDAFASKEIETMLDRIGYEPNELMLKSDGTAVRGRRALQAMMDRESQVASSGVPEHRRN